MDNLENIRAHLRRRDSQFLLKTYLQLILGIVASFAAPTVIVVFFLVICRLWKWNCAWWWFLLGGMVVTLPWLFRQEIGAQGGLLRDVANDFNAASYPKDQPPSFKHVGAMGAALARTRTPVTGAVEFFLIGPGLVIGALRNLRLRALSKEANQDRIVNVVDTLYRLESGAATEKMLEPNETPQQFSQVLAYLLFFDWIGIARDGSKAWLLTESRRELERKPQ